MNDPFDYRDSHSRVDPEHSHAPETGLLSAVAVALGLVCLVVAAAELPLAKAGSHETSPAASAGEQSRRLSPLDEAMQPAGNLGDTVIRAAARQGWTVFWQTTLRPEDSSVLFYPDRMDFVAWARHVLKAATPRVQATFYPRSRIVIVTAPEQAPSGESYSATSVGQ